MSRSVAPARYVQTETLPWFQSEGSRAIVHPVLVEPRPRRHYEADPMGLAPFGDCRIDLRPFVFTRDGQRYRIRAGRCEHGCGAYGPADPEPNDYGSHLRRAYAFRR